MTHCWPEGALRAYLDGELSPEDMKSVAAHLAECEDCERLHSELSVRSSYVTNLMDALVEPMPARARRPTAQSHVSWRWTTVAVALAAGLAIAAYFVPKPEAPRTPVAQTPKPEPEPEPSPVPVLQPEAPVRTIVRGRQASLAAARPSRAAAPVEHFIALDDEPIESGIVMRVTLPGSTPADIVFSPDGRARAIRLVNGNQAKY